MFRKINQFFTDLFSQAFLTLQTIIGILIIGAGLVLSMTNTGIKSYYGLALLITCLTSCIGMVLIASAYFKLLQIQRKKNLHNELDKEYFKDKLSDTEKEKLKIQLEKERLERMRIEVSNVNPIMNLGLVSLNTCMHDFMVKTHRNEDTREGWVFRDDVTYHDEYIGLVYKEFEVQLGVDLKKIRIKNEGEKIIVSGLKSEFQGIKNETSDWLLQEIRNKKIVNGEVESYAISHNDQRIQQSMIEQDKKFRERLNQGLEFKNLEEKILEMARQFITMLLAPLQKEIIFSANTVNGMTIEEFIKDENDKITQKLKYLERMKL